MRSTSNASKISSVSSTHVCTAFSYLNWQPNRCGLLGVFSTYYVTGNVFQYKMKIYKILNDFCRLTTSFLEKCKTSVFSFSLPILYKIKIGKIYKIGFGKCKNVSYNLTWKIPKVLPKKCFGYFR